MLHLGAPPCTSPSVLNVYVTWSSLPVFTLFFWYTPPHSPGSFLIFALEALMVTSPAPNPRIGLSLPANAAAGRTRAARASAVNIHFFMFFPFGLGDAVLRSTARPKAH